MRTQMYGRRLQLVAFTSNERDARTHLAERFSHLQTKSARTAGDKRCPSGDIE